MSIEGDNDFGGNSGATIFCALSLTGSAIKVHNNIMGKIIAYQQEMEFPLKLSWHCIGTRRATPNEILIKRVGVLTCGSPGYLDISTLSLDCSTSCANCLVGTDYFCLIYSCS